MYPGVSANPATPSRIAVFWLCILLGVAGIIVSIVAFVRSQERSLRQREAALLHNIRAAQIEQQVRLGSHASEISTLLSAIGWQGDLRRTVMEDMRALQPQIFMLTPPPGWPAVGGSGASRPQTMWGFIVPQKARSGTSVLFAGGEVAVLKPAEFAAELERLRVWHEASYGMPPTFVPFYLAPAPSAVTSQITATAPANSARSDASR